MASMGRYLIKRVLAAIFTVFVIATVTFFLMRLVPGGPFMHEKAPSPAVQKAMDAKYGLNKPVLVQYKNYMLDALHGDLGYSYKKKGRTVSQIISEKFPVSARIGLIAVFLSLVVGIPIGSISALKRGTGVDNVLRVFSTLGISVPGFVVATILMYFFGVQLKILPTFGLTSPLHYILPVLALAFYPAAYIARLMRASMLDVLEQDYIRTARAKGVSQSMMLFKHALRNALIPVITYLGPLLAYTLTGSLVVEQVFTIPGLGGEFVSSITNRDYPLIMGTTIFLSTLLVFLNLVVDILYKAVDPRVNFDKKAA